MARRGGDWIGKAVTERQGEARLGGVGFGKAGTENAK